MKTSLALIAFCFVQTVTSLFCYWNTGCPYKYFSNKTPYNSVRGDIRDSLVKLTDCEPISIWGLIRHGKRNPGTEFGKHMKESLVIKDYVVSSYQKGNSSLCAQDVENLSNWSVDKDIFDKPFQLTTEGYKELEGIGRRLKQAFPKLLSKLETQDYIFRHAHGMWMTESMKSLIKGLSDRPLDFEPPNNKFDVLAPYAKCDKYMIDVKNNPETYAEANRYLSTSEYLASKDRMQRRLGIDHILTDTNITALFDLCRYTTSGIENKFSPWCALFTTEDLKVSEYIADLRHYYRSGYGTHMNKLFGQITLVDLLKSFQAAKKGNGRKITGYVTHASMMDMIYTALNLFKDEIPLTGAKRRSDRKWRSSKLAVFSSNLMAVLNKCNNNGKENYNVVFYLNEEPLVPICQEGVCTWEEFEEKLTPFLDTDIRFCEV